MAYDVSGTFTRLYSWQDDRDASIKIRADRMDNEMDGFKAAFDLALLRDGRAALTGNLNAGSQKIQALGSGTVTAPSLAWSANSQDGIYHDGTGIAFTSNGTKKAGFSSSGLTVADLIVSATTTFNGAVTFNSTTTGLNTCRVDEYTSSTTWTKQSWGKLFLVEVWGAGGGGGGGAIQTVGNNAGGGTGGGGGGYESRWFTAAQLSASETITIGAAGSGGNGPSGTLASVGGNGTDGGTSSFSTGNVKLWAYGGKGGQGGNLAGDRAGGNGGTTWQNLTATAQALPYVFLGALAVTVTNSLDSYQGGAAGGASFGNTGATAYRNGGNSSKGGGGGGAGGGYAGSSNDPGTGGGPNGSTAAGTSVIGAGTATAGSAGADFFGGGGGGAHKNGASSIGKPGGAGGKAAGGGGGGYAEVGAGSSAGAGGNGGTGFIRVTTFG